MTQVGLAIAAALAGGIAFCGTAGAQQMGSLPFQFQSHDQAFYANTQQQQRIAGAQASSGLAALQQYITNNTTTTTSTSTSVGNLSDIQQILANGAQAYLGLNSSQSSAGNQGAGASTSTFRSNTNNAPQNANGAAQTAAQGQSTQSMNPR